MIVFITAMSAATCYAAVVLSMPFEIHIYTSVLCLPRHLYGQDCIGLH